jgi:hypothetical protein
MSDCIHDTCTNLCGDMNAFHAAVVRDDPAATVQPVVWHPINEEKPPENKLLMVTGPSGSGKHQKFLTLAYYDNRYRPTLYGNIRWVGVTYSEISDQGWYPTHWAYPLELPEA